MRIIIGLVERTGLSMKEKLNFLILLLTGVMDFLLMLKYTELFLKKKQLHKSYFKIKVKFLVILLFVYIVSYYLDKISNSQFSIIGFYLFIYMIYAYIVLDGKVWKKVIVIISEPILLGILIAVLVLIVKSSILGWEYLNYAQEGMIYYYASFILYIVLCIFEVVHKNTFFECKNPYARPVLAIIFSNIVLLIILIKYYVIGTFTKTSFDNVIGFVFIYELLVTFLIILFFYRIGNQLQREHELELQLRLARITKEYEHQIHENTKILKALRHDLKNHFIVLEGYLKKNEVWQAKKYLEQIRGKIIKSNNIVDIDNIALSALLTEKSNLCKEKGISFYTQFVRDARLTISDIDLCTIIGNLMDNAIEAAEKVSKGEKSIDIYIKVKEKIVQIVCLNNYQVEPKIEKGKLFTIKKEKNNHGIGLKNVEIIVDKYDGFMKYDFEKNKFNIEIILKQLI